MNGSECIGVGFFIGIRLWEWAQELVTVLIAVIFLPLRPSKNKHFKLLIRLFNIPINNNLIIDTPRLRILQLNPRLSKSPPHILLPLRPSLPKSVLKDFKTRRSNKHIPRIDSRILLLHLLHALHLNIHHHDQAPGSLLVNSPLTGSIVIPAEISVFDKLTPIAEGGKLFLGNEEIGNALDFAWPGFSRCMRYSESECARVVVEESLDEGSLADA